MNMSCKSCKGAGEVPVHMLVDHHYPRTSIERCPDCQGTGEGRSGPGSGGSAPARRRVRLPGTP